MNHKKHIHSYFEKAFLLLVFLCLASVFSNKTSQHFKNSVSHVEAGLSHTQAILQATPSHVVFQYCIKTFFDSFVFVNKRGDNTIAEKTKCLEKKFAAIKPFLFKGFVVQAFIPKSEDLFPSA